jgi:hypothetical protein
MAGLSSYMGTPFPHQGDFGNCEINIFIKKGCRIYLDYYRDYNGFPGQASFINFK